MWSFVQNKKQQRWLWHAVDHNTGAVLAYNKFGIMMYKYIVE